MIAVHFHTVFLDSVGLTKCPNLIVPGGTISPDESTRLREWDMFKEKKKPSVLFAWKSQSLRSRCVGCVGLTWSQSRANHY